MKQVILVRNDIKMSVGKKIVQACHASVGAALNTDRKTLDRWSETGAKKIALKTADGGTLEKFYGSARKAKLPCFLVADAGLTELSPGTITALAIGPAEDNKIDRITGSIKLL